MRNHWSEVVGYLEPDEARQLELLAVGRDCLEIGSFRGKSSVCIAATAKSLLCVDTFKADNNGQTQTGEITTLSSFLRNINGYENITFVVSSSKNYFEQVGNGVVFDLIFVDGFHEYTIAKEDINNSWALLRSGGILVVHDFAPGCGVPMACEHCGLLPMDGQVMSLAWKVKL